MRKSLSNIFVFILLPSFAFSVCHYKYYGLLQCFCAYAITTKVRQDHDYGNAGHVIHNNIYKCRYINNCYRRLHTFIIDVTFLNDQAYYDI